MLTAQAAWLILAASVIAESLGTAALTLSSGFTRLLPSALTIACYATAVWLMALATKRIEIGMAYAAWAGASAVLTALIGVVWFGEGLGAIKAVGLCTAIVGIVLLNLSGGGS